VTELFSATVIIRIVGRGISLWPPSSEFFGCNIWYCGNCKSTVFCDTTPCSFVNWQQIFGGTCYLHPLSFMWEKQADVNLCYLRHASTKYEETAGFEKHLKKFRHINFHCMMLLTTALHLTATCKLRYLLFRGTNFCNSSSQKDVLKSLSQFCTMSFVFWPLVRLWPAKNSLRWRNKW
jgi:hypothetical protein